MKKILIAALAVLFTGAVHAATLESDITAQGGHSYYIKNLSDSQFATMIRDYETLTAADTLLYTECGKTVFVSSALSLRLRLRVRPTRWSRVPTSSRARWLSTARRSWVPTRTRSPSPMARRSWATGRVSFRTALAGSSLASAARRCRSL